MTFPPILNCQVHTFGNHSKRCLVGASCYICPRQAPVDAKNKALYLTVYSTFFRGNQVGKYKNIGLPIFGIFNGLVEQFFCRWMESMEIYEVY